MVKTSRRSSTSPAEERAARTSSSLFLYSSLSLRSVSMLSWPRALRIMVVLPSSMKGYSKSIMARLETSLVGILVLPFLGYSLRMVVPPLLLDELDEEERELLLRWVRV
jgi:hypothetical protein